MRVALTGPSSTGKTTLAQELMKNQKFRSEVDVFIPSEGVRLLQELGLGGLDSLTRDQSSYFELAYFARKVSQEIDRDRYVVDRSLLTSPLIGLSVMRSVLASLSGSC